MHHPISRLLFAFVLLLPTGLVSTALCAQQGQDLYKVFCASCHLPDRFHVGPSLIEVGKLYGSKPDEFVAWCHEPQQKRKGVIQMPSMAHVDKANLRKIHAWIVSSTKGKKEVKVKGGDRFRASPSMRRRPLVQRIFMPGAGPAAIAVATNDEWHYCWDAGPCRLRYVWKGDFIDGWPVWRANGNALAKVVGEVVLRERVSPLPRERGTRPRFLGYRMKDGLPTFRYRLGKVLVEERITPLLDGWGLARQFTLEGAPAGFRLTLTASDKMTYTSEDGTFDGLVFTPSKAKAASFTIVMEEKE
jgi:cytochrome c551/c552